MAAGAGTDTNIGLNYKFDMFAAEAVVTKRCLKILNSREMLV
jgi:hypothetical protein